MLDPGRPEFKVGDHVWVSVGGSYVFERPVRIRNICERDGQAWAFVEGSEAAVPLDSLTAAPTDAGAAQDATAKAQQEQARQPQCRRHAPAPRAPVRGLSRRPPRRPDRAGLDRHPARQERQVPAAPCRDVRDRPDRGAGRQGRALNAQPMCNVYIGAALRKPDTPPSDAPAMRTCWH